MEERASSSSLRDNLNLFGLRSGLCETRKVRRRRFFKGIKEVGIFWSFSVSFLFFFLSFRLFSCVFPWLHYALVGVAHTRSLNTRQPGTGGNQSSSRSKSEGISIICCRSHILNRRGRRFSGCKGALRPWWTSRTTEAHGLPTFPYLTCPVPSQHRSSSVHGQHPVCWVIITLHH